MLLTLPHISAKLKKRKRRIVFHLVYNAWEICSALEEGCRRIIMENIGENQRNTKMRNDVFEPKMAYLLDNNKTEGTTDASPVFLLRRSTAT